jgi:hypothetical protein
MSDKFTGHMWPTPKAVGNRKSRSHLLAKQWGAPSLEQQVELSLGILPREFNDASELRGANAVSPQLTLFAEAFPASRTPSLADVPAPTTSATSGPSSSDSFASVNPDGSWRKTCQGYSQVMLDGSLEPFSETWPRAGMTRSGTAYQRPPLAPLTREIASGLLPTPNVPNGGRKPKGGLSRTGITPDGKKRQVGLENAVTMWDESSRLLPDSGASGSLNPVFVEWLMGYPLGWTACAASATPSSRKSRNGSRAASSTPKA